MTDIEIELTNFVIAAEKNYPAVDNALKTLLPDLEITYEYVDEKYMRILFNGEGVGAFWHTGYERIDFVFYTVATVISFMGKEEGCEICKQYLEKGVPMVEIFLYYFKESIQNLSNHAEKFENLWI